MSKKGNFRARPKPDFLSRSPNFLSFFRAIPAQLSQKFREISYFRGPPAARSLPYQAPPGGSADSETPTILNLEGILTLEITYLSRLSWFPSVLMLFEVFSVRFQAFGRVSNADLPSEKPQIRSARAKRKRPFRGGGQLSGAAPPTFAKFRAR